jgi:hypothetical protein
MWVMDMSSSSILLDMSIMDIPLMAEISLGREVVLNLLATAISAFFYPELIQTETVKFFFP